jgi:hypothetical protein
VVSAIRSAVISKGTTVSIVTSYTGCGIAEGAIGGSPAMSARVCPPPWPSWMAAFAPAAWIAATSRSRPGRKRSS